MRPVNLLLNIPHELTDADRALIRAACPDVRVQLAPPEFLEQPDRLNGREVDVLVTELVPHSLGNWPSLKFIQLVSAKYRLSGSPLRR
jgi:hypothetical protein